METPFGQVLTAMVTPFTAEGELDYGQAWRLARFLIDNGSDGIVVAGTTGESPTLGDHEKVALFKTVVEAVGERGKVVAGTGTYDTAHSVEMSKRAADLGCAGIMAVTPYYSKPPQEGLFRHFAAIADSTGLPLLVYNIPGRTSRLIEVETLQRLAAHPNIVATKDAVEDVDFTAKTAEAVGDSMAIYSGQDSLTLPLMRVGAIGVVSVAAHLAGPWIARMVDAAAKGDWEEAERLHDLLMPLNTALFVEPNPMPLKGALERVWERVGEPRLPLVPASDETVDAVEQALGKVQQS
ncbi:MAG: 4-hydroxy-tetrahydrodipicolinate synthase [Acidimicrobiia bacterium]|nr:4-hydroxy-tetrahydrodipicolinate synthase [Acidimicrobiia bacterium]